MTKSRKIQFVWHCHHDILLEPLTELFSVRVQYIKEEKLEDEQPLRLRLFRKVKGKLPQEIIEAKKTCDEAWKTYIESWKARNKSWGGRRKAWEVSNKAGGDAYKKAENVYHEAGKTYDKALKFK